MKKLFGALAIALFVVLPMAVKAEINLGSNNMKCSEVDKNSDGKYFVTCVLSATTTENEPLTSVTIDLTFNDPSNIELDENSIKGSGAFSAVSVGTSISFNAATPQTGKTIELGSFTYYIKDLTKDCGFIYSPTGADIDTPQQTVTVKPVENPKTGSAVSYVVIGTGLLLVAGAFVLSRKNTKMYNV